MSVIPFITIGSIHSLKGRRYSAPRNLWFMVKNFLVSTSYHGVEFLRSGENFTLLLILFHRLKFKKLMDAWNGMNAMQIE